LFVLRDATAPAHARFVVEHVNRDIQCALRQQEKGMARDGYLIIDSDLPFNERGDLWERYLDEPYRANPPRFFGGMQQALKEESKEDKGNTDNIRGMEVQGPAIPSFAKQSGAEASSRDLQRRSRPRHPHFAIARSRAF